ncbi:MAG TPA: M13 family metallopeptidase [Gemmatimonadales bacterium]|nr:M13 family metallopeptidase [Gemmatimonadales bacterium]
MSRPIPPLATLLLTALAATSLPAQQQSKPLDPANFDTTCSACQDFFTYANGGWVKRTEIPGDQAGWSSFHELQEQNFAAIKGVLEDAARSAASAKEADQRKLGTFYANCMDSAAVERAGLKPLAGELGRIAAVRNQADIQRVLARLALHQVPAGFALYSSPDARRSERTIAEISQSGLGLPDRDYYLKTDSASVAMLAKYQEHVARMLWLGGDDSAAAARGAERVIAMEKALARASMSQEAQRDPEAVYHLTSLTDLGRQTPRFDWAAYFRELGVAAPAEVNVSQPEFLAAVDSLMAALPAADWRYYLRWQLLHAAAPTLAAPFVNENFRFNGTVLQGIVEQRPRWKRCLQLTDNLMGEILGQAYVRRYFSPEAKARALEMVRNIQAEFRHRLGALTWMREATKAKAYQKLDAIINRIGYPDRWRDHTGLEIKREPLAASVQRASAFEGRWNLSKIGKPTDRGEWNMTPPTVNASYNTSRNAITFPAGILQPPFFDPKADDAVNYGGMGGVIGHEITHGFDDAGRQFDAQGNLSGWWDSTDNRAFADRAEGMVRQASAYVAVDTLTVNGRLTLGENIADLGGVLIAYGAYRRSLEGKPEPPPVDGLTGDQRFFLGWAQIWRSRFRPEFARMLVTVDPHAPNAFRANGPLANLPEFARAFGCKPGDPMVRSEAERVQIW